MISDFLFALNAVLPIFAVALTGYILKNVGFLTDCFVTVADKLVFKLLLPCMLFTKVAFINSGNVSGIDMQLLVYCVTMAIVLCLILCFVVPIFVKDKAKSGAFIQGVFRSNVAFLGVPFAISLFGDDGGMLAAIILAAIVPIYNVLAVAVLCIFNPDKSNQVSFFKRVTGIAKGIITNPLIISIVVALPFGIFGIGQYIPPAVIKTIGYFSDASTPLAILLVGASFSFSAFKNRAGLAVAAAVLKTVVSPAVFMLIGYSLFGFVGVHLGIIMIIFGTPTAISSYIMAKNMNSDGPLANQIVLLTTLFSMLTIFVYSFIMRNFGMF